MSSITTHYFFGEEMVRRFSDFLPDEACREAFLFGNQGPDPLFFCFTSLESRKIRSMGLWIHDKHCMAALKELLKPWGGENPALIRAYQMGMLCHYALDRNVHPYVYRTEPLLLASGVVDRDYRFPHSRIESNLDVILLHHLGSSAYEFNPADVLPESALIDGTIGAFYRRLARKIYDWDIPTKEFVRTFANMRFVERLLHSKLGIKRRVISPIDHYVLGDSFYRAMSLTDLDYHRFDYANVAHDEWVNRKGETVTWDLFELLQDALADAEQMIWSWLDGIPVDQLSGCYNFKGEKVPNLRRRAL